LDKTAKNYDKKDKYMAKILVVDDERAIRNTLKEILEFEGYSVDLAEDGKQALEKVGKDQYDLIYSDVKMPGMDGIEFLEEIKKIDRSAVGPSQSDYKTTNVVGSCPVVMISGHGNIETAVEAIKKGAYDFIEKPLDLNRLLVATRNALENKNLSQELGKKDEEIKTLKKQAGKRVQMVGSSKSLARVREIIDKVAPTEARVLITGANGTGKEVVARMIHAGSGRAGQTLVEVNCAAIPSELIESELFGHMKGSFTGAVKDRAGKFEQADGGTLFLDEIGDMSLDAQTKVLRALQESEICRVGSDKTIKVNVRVLAATNKDLAAEIAAGRFREDLYHRLNVIPIHVPALDERKEDIPELVEYFCEQICGEQGVKVKTFEAAAVKALQERNWPGNIRELRNVVERLIILGGNTISVEDVNLYA
jgi:DNA-binding NtrC family response regulator